MLDSPHGVDYGRIAEQAATDSEGGRGVNQALSFHTRVACRPSWPVEEQLCGALPSPSLAMGATSGV
ncbi:hypothetical protein CC79DRAFT_1152927 [Sarocladium strictum]